MKKVYTFYYNLINFMVLEMKNLFIATITVITTTLVGCSGTDTQLMRDAYAFNESTYDYVEEVDSIPTDGVLNVTFGTGGRNCTQLWTYQNGKIADMGTKNCTHYETH